LLDLRLQLSHLLISFCLGMWDVVLFGTFIRTIHLVFHKEDKRVSCCDPILAWRIRIRTDRDHYATFVSIELDGHGTTNDCLIFFEGMEERCAQFQLQLRAYQREQVSG